MYETEMTKAGTAFPMPLIKPRNCATVSTIVKLQSTLDLAPWLL
jgi:hypothetical protein